VLSGRQLLQVEPINLRRVSDRSFKTPTEYVLKPGMTIFGASGRSEGRQGSPALITEDRVGWLASDDVMRLRPLPGVKPAGLWLAVATPQAQVQIKALSFGSVVDHMIASGDNQALEQAIRTCLAQPVSLATRQRAIELLVRGY
jgi:hypothetical protein